MQLATLLPTKLEHRAIDNERKLNSKMPVLFITPLIEVMVKGMSESSAPAWFSIAK